MADCCLRLIEEAIFHRRQTERVRMLLNRIPEEKRSEQRFLDLSARVRAVETKGEQDAPPNGGPVDPLGNTAVRGGPPSVS